MSDSSTQQGSGGFLAHLKRRGVLRVAASYALIAWLLLQIGDVVFDPFDFGEAAMRVLLIVVAVGFPVSLLLAWFFELTPAGIELDHEPADAPRPAVSGIRRYTDVVIIGVLVVIVALLLARQGGLIDEGPGEQVVAVLPFANMSTRDEDAYFGEGLADTLIHKLGELNELVVLASQSTFQFKGRDLDLKVVGEKLGATTIMTGSVQRSGSALRVNARLVEVDSGVQLWSDSYDRTLQDVFAIQDDIANSVTAALHLVLAPAAQQRLSAPPTEVLSAYDAYILGNSRLARRSGENTLMAVDFFNQAIEADPDYALAYAGLVEAWYLMGDWPNEYGWAGTRERAISAAERAVTLDPELGEAWLAKALVAFQERSHGTGESLPDGQLIALYEKAIELSPNNAMAYKYFANLFTNLLSRDYDRSRQLMLRAARLDPRSGIIKINIGEGFLRENNYAEAEVWFRQAARAVEPYFPVGLMSLISLHTHLTGRLDEAARWSVSWFDAFPGEHRAYWNAVHSLLNLGALDEAKKVRERFTSNDVEDVEFRPKHWTRLVMGVLLERAAGDLEAAAALARRWSRDYWEQDETWPVVEDWAYNRVGMAALALEDIRDGRAREALDRYLGGYPGGFAGINHWVPGVWHPPIMTAALYRQVGEPGQARQLLEEYLAFVKDLPQDSHTIKKGWAPFIILAMLGETNAALDELEAMVDAGYLNDWWMLPEGAFDPDYAKVLADPRFERLYGRITARVDELRAAYLAEPGLPGGFLH